ncbi:hypothetical protein RJ639_032671 [Escallonia herrerae]|uniref:RWP-RK domain-containing protein n=1 Tax=Escallonia herrerae TaxID=1293975 RepID=A0AA88X0N9_9ASTE|nr:hypothetical protein RJ639_032671 [Escallonia herrerae]
MFEQQSPFSSLDQFFLECDPYLFPQQNEQNIPYFDDITGDDLWLFDANFSSFCDNNILLDDAKPMHPTGTTEQNFDQHLAAHVGHHVVGEVPTEADQLGFTSDSSMEEVMVKRQSGSRPKSSALELDEIQKHFHVPITKAAKELRVGLTVLKKRCRELNIMRWPHRKIKSLKSLIDNVKELGLTGEIGMLEEHKRMLEQLPELELTERTKKLRQACFKANYKKRRFLTAAALS